MTNRRSLVIWCITGVLVGALTGGVLGHVVANRRAKYISQLMAVTEYENLALLQYKHADTADAIDSMQDLLNFMNRVELAKLAPDKYLLEFDRNLTYIRLAVLEEKMGDVEAYRRDMAAASESAKNLGAADSSEAHLRKVIGKLDSNIP